MKNEILDLLDPNGSEHTFLTASCGLPADHWIYAPQCPDWDETRDTIADLPQPIMGDDRRAEVRAAIRWAIRASTMNGADPNFDPDAMVQNTIYALCGPWIFNDNA